MSDPQQPESRKIRSHRDYRETRVGDRAIYAEGDVIVHPETTSKSVPQPPQGIPQNLPRTGVKLFVGRDEAMQTLHKQLQATERVAITSITGMGGIGKTELALQYAIQYREECYPGGVCWLQVRGVDVGIGIINFARSQLNLNPPEDFELDLQVSYCWRNWPIGEVLIVFDDVTDYREIEAFLPPADSRFKVLMTTRHQWLGQSFWQLELEVLEEAAALELLVSFVGEERIQGELEEAKALCAFLGFLPLGLELVGRYLQRKRDLSLAKTLQRLDAKRLEHQSLVERFSQDMTAQRGMAAAFELSWQELGEDAQELGRLLSLFGPATIPWFLVEGCMPEADEEDLEDLRDGLVNLSLLQWVDEGSYQLHLLIREFFRSKLSGSGSVDQMKQSVCGAIAGLADEIPSQLIRQDVLEIEPLIAHLTEVAANLTDWLTNEDLVWPFMGLGRFYESQGSYSLAEPWYEQCLATAKARLGSEHPDTAGSLNNLALLYNSQGRHDEAEPLLVEALKITQHQLGPEHTETATGLNNLAGLYTSQGRYDQAEHLLVEALEIRQRQLGPEHLDTAGSLNNLAFLYNSQGRYDEAEPLLVKALEITQHQLGSEHPDTATNLDNLAFLYDSQGWYDEAESLYVEALEIRQSQLGPEHPNTARSLNNLAGLYNSQGWYDEAEPLYLKALSILFSRLKQEHPNVQTVWRNYLIFLQQVKDENRQGELSNEMSLQILSDMEDNAKE